MGARWQDRTAPQYLVPDHWNANHPSVRGWQERQIAAAKASTTPPPGVDASTAGKSAAGHAPRPGGTHHRTTEESARGMAIGSTVAFLALVALIAFGGKACDAPTSGLCAEVSCEEVGR